MLVTPQQGGTGCPAHLESSLTPITEGASAAQSVPEGVGVSMGHALQQGARGTPDHGFQSLPREPWASSWRLVGSLVVEGPAAHVGHLMFRRSPGVIVRVLKS